MFGIKTRKTKEIERLQKRVEELEYALIAKPHFIHTSNANVQHLRCSCLLDDNDMIVDYAKEQIAREFVNNIKDYIIYDIENEGGNKVKVVGSLYVVRR